MIIQPSDLIQELNRALLVRMYHDNTPDSLTTVNIVFNYLKVIGSRSTMLCIQSEEKLLQQFQKQRNEPYNLKIILLVNVGYNLNIEQLVGPETKVILVSSMQPINLSNLFSRSVLIYDDNTTILQFLAVFAPENLRGQVQDFVRQESERQQIPKKSNVQIIKMQSNDRSQQNKSPYDGMPNRFKKVLEQTQSQSQRYSQPQQHKLHRHGREGLTAYNDMNMLNVDGIDQHSQQARLDEDEGTVDDLDEINDDEYVEEIEETDTSIRDFINDGGDNSRDIYSPVDYFLINNQQNQLAGQQNALTQQENVDWTLEDTVTDGFLSQNSLIHSDVARSQLSAQQSDELEQSEELIQDADLEALRAVGQQGGQVGANKSFYDILCRLDVTISETSLRTIQEWISGRSALNVDDAIKSVAEYSKQLCFSSPTSGRLGLLILRYSTSYDVQNRVFINDVLFQAFTGIFYRLQLSQACSEYVSYFYEQVSPFIPDSGGELQYLRTDFNLPLFRVLKIVDSVSCSYFQFCVPATLSERGLEARTGFLLSRLGVRLQAAQQSYGELGPRARRAFRERYLRLRRGLRARLFAPNLLYRVHRPQLAAQDFAYLLEILPDQFKLLNYQQAYLRLKSVKDAVYHVITQYLHAHITAADRAGVQCRDNFILCAAGQQSSSGGLNSFSGTQNAQKVLSYLRFGSYVERRAIFTKKGAAGGHQSEAEGVFFRLGQLDGCAAFAPLKLQRHKKDAAALEHFVTTVLHAEREIFIKYNAVTWLGGFLGSKFISEDLKLMNKVVTNEDDRKHIEAFMQQKMQ